MTLHDFLRQGKATYPNKTALIFGDLRWTYAELDEITDHLATSLSQLGIQTGDRVAFHLGNCPELIFGYFACFKLGAIAVPLNIRMKAAELEYVLNHCQARICISQPDLYPEVQMIRENLSDLNDIYLIGNANKFVNTKLFAELLEPSHQGITFPNLPIHSVAAILYTSGTTARPKGVTHTHETLKKTVLYNVEAAEQTFEDRISGMLPMSHIFGFTLQMLSPLSIGATLIILPKFDPELALQAIQQHRATKLYGLPVMYNALVNHPTATRYDLSSVGVGFAGGDAVPVVLQQKMQAIFGVELAEGSGMTEVIPYCLNRPGSRNRVGSIGPASVGMTLRLVDEQGQDVAPGAVGEILVKSDATMIGYWNNPEATAEVLKEGWMHTGDLAYQDAEGYYWFVSRRKEIIIRGGSNISPLEVEAVLYQHPAVREAAVVGVPDGAIGERVYAFVAVQAGQSVTESDLREFVAERIAAYKVPETITFLPELPKGLTGKIHRKTLKEWAIETISV
jgi:long-chain acyl-CoA synthetase